jgi:hypothetical protein
MATTGMGGCGAHFFGAIKHFRIGIQPVAGRVSILLNMLRPSPDQSFFISDPQEGTAQKGCEEPGGR